MTGTDLLLASDASYDDIAKMLGQDTGGGQTFPSFSINRNADDDDGNQLPLGHYNLFVNGINWFAPRAYFRPYFIGYRYRLYDSDEQKYVNSSIIFTDWRQEAIDECGGIRCGKLTRAVIDTLPDADKKAQKAIKLARVLFGTVRMEDAVSSKGAKNDVPPTPCVWYAQGDNFMPIDETIQSLTKNKRLVINHEIELGPTERKKSGATVYYQAKPSVDVRKSLPILPDDVDLLRTFSAEVKRINDSVQKKYDQSLKRTSRPSDADDMKVLASLDADLNDPVDDIG